MNRLAIVIGAAAVVAGLGMHGQAGAVTINRHHFSHGTASCQAALPVFDGNIRKRPLAIANEGNSNAFVTCDTDNVNDAASGARFHLIVLAFVNRSSQPVTVSCTLVDGVSYGLPLYFPKMTGPIAVNAVGTLAWFPSDNGGSKFGVPATSCDLPPGVEIAVVGFFYDEEIGA